MWDQAGVVQFPGSRLHHDTATNSVVIQGECSFEGLEPLTSEGAYARMTGAARVVPPPERSVVSGWAIPLSFDQPDALGAASGAGAVVVSVGPGLVIETGNGPVPLKWATVLLAPGSITLVGVQSRSARVTLELWR